MSTCADLYVAESALQTQGHILLFWEAYVIRRGYMASESDNSLVEVFVLQLTAPRRSSRCAVRYNSPAVKE